MAGRKPSQGGAKSSYGAAAQAVTANRLTDGVVVYLTADGGWSEWVRDAAAAEDKEARQALLARAEKDAEASLVVGPYLFDVVSDEDGRPRPASNREIIRSLGPTNHTSVGKQAELEG